MHGVCAKKSAESGPRCCASRLTGLPEYAGEREGLGFGFRILYLGLRIEDLGCGI